MRLLARLQTWPLTVVPHRADTGTLRMRYRLTRLIVTTTIACFAANSFSAAQSGSLRDLVREHGDISLISISCGPVTGLREILQHTQLTIEGTITLAESRLTAEEDSVYTEYIVDATRVFRAPALTAARTPGPTELSPFIANGPVTRPSAATKLRVRLRAHDHGRVTLDGGVVTATSGFPTLTVGQHVILSAYFDATRRAWAPFGVFEVQDGRVVPLDRRLQTKNYGSVDAFAAAVANPPPTLPLSER
jgi:hypothetical protein